MRASEKTGKEEIVAAELTYWGGHFESDVQIRIGENGRIAEVGPLGLEPTRRLDRQALIPGFVNAHSHAFQRGLRGSGETFPAGSGSFWTWREAMYALVGALDEENLYALCHTAFREMLACGMTTVGEFHYLHHRGEERDFAFDDVVLQAASDAGIRMVLLETYYRTSRPGHPLEGAQRRFACESPEEFWRQLDVLAEKIDRPTQSLGVVVHSLRAAELDDLEALHRGALERGLPFHIHVEEQHREIEQCLVAYGQRPMQILNERLEISGATTAVHCTHTDPGDLERYLEAGGNVCLCPLTEADLGDGIAAVGAMLEAGGHLSLGSDQNARISMCEEMRWLEYGQRLAGQCRGVVKNESGEVGRRLFEIATLGGARALGLEAGTIEAGRWADLAAIDLDHPTLAHCPAESLLDALVFGAGDGAVEALMVGGRWL